MVTNHILNEMINTENTYRQNLGIINSVGENIRAQASTDLDALDQMELSKGLELIAKISAKQEDVAFFFNSLKAQLINDTNNLITEIDEDAFAATVNALKHTLAQLAKDYANYTIFYDNYSKNIAPILKADRLQRAINRAGGNNMPLAGLLINPIQRFPRYEMLFRELNKHIPQDHNAKPFIQDLGKHTQDTCHQINDVAQFYASVKQGYAGVDLHQDSTFRRQVKGYLNNVMKGVDVSSQLSEALTECGLSMISKGKRFTSKRTYSFANQAGDNIFDIVVNRHAMTFRFTENFDSLPVNEKIALFKLQYFLTHEIEKSFQAINVNDVTKRHLEILGEIDYLNTPSTVDLVLEDEDEDEDFEITPAQVHAHHFDAPDFRQQLNTLFLRHKGLTRQGSLVKASHDQITPATYAENTPRWKLPGLAR